MSWVENIQKINKRGWGEDGGWGGWGETSNKDLRVQ